MGPSLDTTRARVGPYGNKVAWGVQFAVWDVVCSQSLCCWLC